MRRSVRFGRLLTLTIACLALVAAACSSSTEPKASEQPTSERSTEADAGPAEADAGSTEGDAGATEGDAATSGEPGAESGETDDADRIERTGIAPRTGPLDRAPARGWSGETLFGHGNDWEPNVAADPSGPFVYMITTRYSGHPACPTCTKYPYIALKISKNDGQTFGRRKYLCPCPGRTGGQYDPQIETDAHGDVYAAWINGGFRVVESRSTDHGKTWSTPNVVTHGGPGWSDHPWLAVSPRGKDVYIAFNHQDSYIAQSHDFGRTWEKPVKTNAQHRYHYAGGGYVFPNGDVVFSQANYPLGEGYAGPVHIVSTWSHDEGKTWHTTQVDSVGVQPPCVDNRGCPNNHLGGHANLAADGKGNLLIAYDGAIYDKGPQYVYVRRSTDDGKTWGPRTRLSPAGKEIATTPTVSGTGKGAFSVWYYDERNGPHEWNVWYRSTTDGGHTWSPDVRISDARGGVGYKNAQGFGADYGDYGDMAVMSNGQTFAVWGEGYSYYGPGGTWYNRTTG
jgi:hypothetical protein